MTYLVALLTVGFVLSYGIRAPGIITRRIDSLTEVCCQDGDREKR